MADTIRRVYEIDAKIATTAQQSLREIQRSLRETENAARSVGKASKEAAKDVGGSGGLAEAWGHLNFKSVGARRELLVLAHELSQSQYKAFAGSLLVLGERIDATALIMSAAGIAAIALGAAISLVAIAVAKGAIEQDKYNKSLIITGNASATTNDSIQALAKSVAGTTRATAGSVQELAVALAATGEIGPRAFAPMVEVMARVKKLTGETAEEVGNRFKNFGQEPTKAALELNKQFNFLDSAMYKQILRLEELGDKQGAAALAARLLSDTLADRQAPTVNKIVLLYEALLRGLDRIGHYFHSIGAETTFEAKLDSLYKKLGDLQERANNPGLLEKLARLFGGGSQKVNEEEQEALRADINAAIRAKVEKDNKARNDAEDARIKKEAVNAQIELDILDKRTKGYTRTQKALDELAKQEAAIVADRRRTDPTFKINPADHAARVAQIIKENRTEADKRLDNAVTARLRQLGEESAGLKEQIRQYEEYGKRVNAAARAKLEFDIAQGNLRGAPKSDIAELRKRADEVDKDRERLKQLEGAASADKRIAQLRSEAEAHAMNSREMQLAVELGKLEQDGLVKGTPAYEERARVIKELTTQIHDNALARKLAANEATTADEARAITDQIDLIGKSTLERSKHTAALRIQRQVTKELLANPENRAEIIASATRQIDLLSESLERAYEESRKFESGVKESFAKYIEETANGAQFASGIIEGSIKHLEDIFVNFAKTGKLHFKDLFMFMADEFLRQSVRMTISGILKENGTEEAVGGALKSLASVFGINFDTKGAAGGGGAGAAGAALEMSTATAAASASLGLLDASILTTDFSMTTLAASAEAASVALANVATSSAVGGAGDVASDAFSDFDWSSLFDFANGGIMTKHGALPLNTYMGGGIATGPQMAIFGEGRQNEAYVPLPDGRSIPVTVKGNQQSDTGAPMNVTIENHNGSDVQVKQQKNRLGKDELRVVIRAAKQEILDDIYGGGEMDKALADKYGLDRAPGTPRSGR